MKPSSSNFDPLLADLPERCRWAVSVPFMPSDKPKFTFIDLFAGIGGFRIAMQNLGGKCVFTSEWDTAAQKTYFANFGEIPYGDIALPETKAAIPDGFPCQPFSIFVIL